MTAKRGRSPELDDANKRLRFEEDDVTNYFEYFKSISVCFKVPLDPDVQLDSSGTVDPYDKHLPSLCSSPLSPSTLAGRTSSTNSASSLSTGRRAAISVLSWACFLCTSGTSVGLVVGFTILSGPSSQTPSISPTLSFTVETIVKI